MTKRSDSAGGSREEGMALLIVIWTVGILGLIALIMTTAARTEVNRMYNIVESAKAEAIADAGAYRAIAGMLETDATRRLRADGTIYRWKFEGVDVLIAIQSEAGKIDLNAASDQILENLFSLAGVDPEAAPRLVGALRDFADRNDLPRALGAEDDEYHKRGLIDGAKDAPFDDTGELQQVVGISSDLYGAVAEVITVYSSAKSIDRGTAPRMALLALPGIKREEVEEILAIRAKSASDQLASPIAQDVSSGNAAVLRHRVFTVKAFVRTSGATFERLAVVRLEKDRSHPFTLLDWRRTWRSEAQGHWQ